MNVPRPLCRRGPRHDRGSTKVLILSAVLVVAVLSMACLGYLATQQWRRSAIMVAERRVDEVDALLATALTRDMGGAQSSILMALGSEQIDLNPPHELSEIFARAFARFPYPESFFAWKSNRDGSHAVLFNRTDRPPGWYRTHAEESLFPVTVIEDSPMVGRFVTLTRESALPDERSALFDTDVDGIPYQVVTRLFFDSDARDRVVAIVGFTVNLEWVKTSYFSEITRQIEHIGGSVESSLLSLSIIDDNGAVVSQTRPPIASAAFRERRFPFAFFDPSSVSLAALRSVSPQRWTARVSMADDALIGDAEKGAERTALLLFVAAGLSIAGLVLALYSLHRNVELAAMKADFVAMVTHELKTPLAGISLVAETLSKGSYASANAVAEYGVLLSRETTRLKRLVENVLSFSRLTNAKKIYSMAAADIGALVSEAMERLQPLIQEKHIEMRCEVPDVLPHVVCDREQITRTFENLIENAIKYSDPLKKAEIRVCEDTGRIRVSIRDYGRGIPPEDLAHVFDRFFRGRNSGSGGSGLGLAIAKAIISDHGGSISVDSVVGAGTVVTVILPAVQESK